MMLRLPIAATSVADWMRRAAMAVNNLMTNVEQQSSQMESRYHCPIPISDNAPDNPEKGQWFFNKTSQKAMMWDGTQWQNLWE
ncbi:hypothetical protein [Zymomonas mobilis]|uniref:hypothetical protein n=1 Tax=Zymomonas mobilis TaxID=542 RepID=UPI0003C76F6A|nr:hypothetical protein [Zymomonas mobilis]AHB10183.1 hypothetical protein ZCP4_0882 [Zymomonas mobilis subsp. mobilis str. CP4 = NRRL B-14023]AHJ70490.1 hypothetical protein A254_00872 [Zymomonas mobilis subsp. mobilis NRRL B-12526]AHJ72345.1 hypothetical protein A265_00872 [Zymomonas mobilis subsp. mobilis str. CP4 = NRRL B-14023]TWE26827.1 hypothetical protein FBY52_101290 [Zymomonas mobilis]